MKLLGKDKETIDEQRRTHLAWAEFVDAWRIVPRAVLVAYSYLVYEMVNWYIHLEPHLPKEVLDRANEFTPEQLSSLMIDAPTTQHAALISVIVGAAAAVFGLYSGSSKDWSKGFIKWMNGTTPQSNIKPEEEPEKEEAKKKK